MEKKYTVTLRLSYQQYAWLGALCRRSKQTQSEVIRSLIENGTVRYVNESRKSIFTSSVN